LTQFYCFKLGIWELALKILFPVSQFARTALNPG